MGQLLSEEICKLSTVGTANTAEFTATTTSTKPVRVALSTPLTRVSSGGIVTITAAMADTTVPAASAGVSHGNNVSMTVFSLQLLAPALYCRCYCQWWCRGCSNSLHYSRPSSSYRS